MNLIEDKLCELSVHIQSSLTIDDAYGSLSSLDNWSLTQIDLINYVRLE